MEEGFDCSGLALFTHARIGIQIPRTARAQFKNRYKVTARNILPADLVFFSIPGKSKTIHVGIYVGENQFIHAPGKGRKIMIASLESVYFRRHFIGAGNFFTANRCR